MLVPGNWNCIQVTEGRDPKQRGQNMDVVGINAVDSCNEMRGGAFVRAFLRFVSSRFYQRLPSAKRLEADYERGVQQKVKIARSLEDAMYCCTDVPDVTTR